MILFEVGAMLTSYVVIRVFEGISKSRTRLQLPSPQPAKSSSTNQQTAMREIVTSVEDEKVLLRRLEVSTASMGLSTLRQFFYPPLAPFSLAVYIYTNLPFMKHAEKSILKEKKVDVDVLFFIGNTLTLSLGQYFTATFGVWLLYLGRYLVKNAKDRSEKVLITEFNRSPGKVWIRNKNGIEMEVFTNQVQKGDIVVINTGEIVPVDGKVVEGHATLDQRALTGESQPVEKTIGDDIFASTLLIRGQLSIETSQSGQETAIAKIGEILQQTTNFKSKNSLQGEIWANEVNLSTLMISTFMLPIFGVVKSTIFLNSHMGNNIRVLGPLGTLNYITAASRKGILVKDGRVLEALNRVDTIFFDKTGTLTEDKLSVSKIITLRLGEEKTVLTYAAAAEQHFTHPIALALLEKARSMKLSLPEAEDTFYHLGYGISLKLEGRTVHVGSPRFLDEMEIPLPAFMYATLSQAHKNASSLVMVAVDYQVIGAIEIISKLRPEVFNMIHQLRELGINHFIVISGDHQQATRKVADRLGIKTYYYDALPEDKAQIVQQLQAQGRSVCFVGDGVNDAIAMKQADVSVSLRGGAAITADAADIILLEGNLCRFVDLFVIAQALAMNLVNNLVLSTFPGLINVTGAFIFHFSILTSLLIGGGFGLLGVGNAAVPLMEIKDKTQEEPAKLQERKA